MQTDGNDGTTGVAVPLAAPSTALAVAAETLMVTLGTAVLSDGADPPTYRFHQPIRFAEGLRRRGLLDLAARRFRSTLWAGDHRCLDHLELADLRAVACDPLVGRLVLDGATVRLVLSRHGGLSIVPLSDGQARAARRAPPQAPDDSE